MAMLEPATTRTLVGITGPPGCGKTHLARHLHTELVTANGPDAARIVAMDGFHLRNEELEPTRAAAPQGRAGHVRRRGFVRAARRLRDGTARSSVPAFSRAARRTRQRARSPSRPTSPVVLVEGNYLLLDEGPWAEVASRCSISPCTSRRPPTCGGPGCWPARSARHGSPAAAQRWIETVDDPNAAIVEQTKARADHVWSCRASCPDRRCGDDPPWNNGRMRTSAAGCLAGLVLAAIAVAGCAADAGDDGPLLRAGGRQPGGDPRPPDDGR